MSTAPVDPAEPGSEPEPDTVAPAAPGRDDGGWTFVSLIANDGQEPPSSLTERAALAAWSAISAPWHPSLLALADELPRIESIDSPSPPGPNEIRIVAGGDVNLLPSGYQTQAEDAGTIVIEAGADRDALVREIRGRMGISEDIAGPEGPATTVALDFQALGTARWWLRDLTIAMGHADMLDAESPARSSRGRPPGSRATTRRRITG